MIDDDVDVVGLGRLLCVCVVMSLTTFVFSLVVIHWNRTKGGDRRTHDSDSISRSVLWYVKD